MKDSVVTKHPAFGMIQISRCSGRARLYDSPIDHLGYIAIRIMKAEMHRDLNRSWHFPKEEIVEVCMSETQFAQAITSMNTSGTPVTLSHYRDPKTGERVQTQLKWDDLPDNRQLFSEEVAKATAQLAKMMSDVQDALAKVLDTKSVPKKVKEEAIEVVSGIKRRVEDLPFIQKQFVEAMDQAENVAKTEVVALANSLIQQKGLEALGVKRVDLVGYPEDDTKGLLTEGDNK
jgi:hypothetical protein